VIDQYPAPRAAREVRLPVSDYARLIGADPGAARMIAVLDALDLKARQEGDALVVRVPSSRPDIERPVDLIEEIARIEGYEALPPTLALGTMGHAHEVRDDAHDLDATISPLVDEQATRAARELLLGRGLREAINYNFIDPALLARLGFAAEDVRAHPIAVRNPLSEKTAAMRTSLLPGLLTNLLHNRSRRVVGANLFEVGRVYLRDDVAGVSLPAVVGGPRWVGHAEPTMLAVMLADPAHEHFKGGRSWDLHDARSMAQDVVSALSRRPLSLEPLEGAGPGMLHPYASAALVVEGQAVGWLGALHPDLLLGLELEGEVFAFELDVTALLALRGPLRPMRGLGRYPASQRDFALVLDAGTPWAAVEAALAGIGDPRIESWRLFDVYEGEQVGAGRKSMAISVTLRDAQGTLSEEALVSLQGQIVGRLREVLGAEPPPAPGPLRPMLPHGPPPRPPPAGVTTPATSPTA
jgi:phenylalanyl-tRNA synthetase beta chain